MQVKHDFFSIATFYTQTREWWAAYPLFNPHDVAPSPPYPYTTHGYQHEKVATSRRGLAIPLSRYQNPFVDHSITNCTRLIYSAFFTTRQIDPYRGASTPTSTNWVKPGTCWAARIPSEVELTTLVAETPSDAAVSLVGSTRRSKTGLPCVVLTVTGAVKCRTTYSRHPQRTVKCSHRRERNREEKRTNGSGRACCIISNEGGERR